MPAEVEHGPAWLAAVTAATACLPAAAEIPGNRITIAVLTDLSGSNSVLSGW